MKVRADLHIHSVLSPCGDIEMTPSFIVRRAVESGLGVIALTDHNSTRQATLVRELGERAGVMVVFGAEVNTREEVHAVALVDGEEARLELQKYLDDNLIKIPNKEEVFGYQLVVNEQEEITYQEEFLLINSIDRSVDEVEKFVHSLGGIFIPAHIDKTVNSLLSQLGYVPPDLEVEALEVSKRCDVEALTAQYPYLNKYSIIRSSDAHYPDDFGAVYTELEMEELSFAALKKALGKKPAI